MDSTDEGERVRQESAMRCLKISIMEITQLREVIMVVQDALATQEDLLFVLPLEHEATSVCLPPSCCPQ